MLVEVFFCGFMCLSPGHQIPHIAFYIALISGMRSVVQLIQPFCLNDDTSDSNTILQHLYVLMISQEIGRRTNNVCERTC